MRAYTIFNRIKHNGFTYAIEEKKERKIQVVISNQDRTHEWGAMPIISLFPIKLF
ncbi:MAG: hypothetical protein M1477_03430 [Candidatus Thermoplasmatota archaeon]|nr:hypothetical protein [Candidatus Thermoplasmatota archaeon]